MAEQRKRRPSAADTGRTSRDGARASRESRSTRESRPARGARPEREPRAIPPVAPSHRRGPVRTSPAPKSGDAPAAAAASDDRSQKLQKVLAQAGLGSRREMEELILAGKVLVNGEVATIGTRVNPDDVVKVGRRQIRFKLSAKLPRVIIYHKPEGEIVSRDDPEGRASVFEKLPAIRSGKWLAIGRLDYNTCGLLIFTTSGELANRLAHPRFEVEREYAVRVMGELSEAQMHEMTKGVELTDGEAHFEIIETQGGNGRNHWYRVIVREGRNRLVRRMFEHMGLQVSRLMRVRFGIVNLPPHLKRSQHLELTEAQTRRVLEWLATGTSAVAAADAAQAEAAATAAPTRRPRGDDKPPSRRGPGGANRRGPASAKPTSGARRKPPTGGRRTPK
ncbi:MAG: pseudouridine synthase [Burkholderiales bacterium]|nr:pseudouridine synthase [Burkholderiales bacterium]